MRGDRLLWKYVILMGGLVSLSLVVSGAVGFVLFSREHSAQLQALQLEKATGAAARIEQYVQGIERQLGWVLLPGGGDADQPLEQRKLEHLKLLRQVPAITELVWLDRQGIERLRVSRLAMDEVNSRRDHGHQPYFHRASAMQPYFGEVYFHKDTEPYLTIARVAPIGEDGMVVAQVNLKFVWDVVSRIEVGRSGTAYVVDAGGTLIAHPDMSLVLRRSNLMRLGYVQAALASPGPAVKPAGFVQGAQGTEVLAASAHVAGPGWQVFVELPRSEALEPLVVFVQRAILLLVVGVAGAGAASILISRRMVRPIQALQAGAHAIGSGRLQHRINVHTGDEIETLAAEFNAMAQQLGQSYADLENKVVERTRAAEGANLAKSRFLAAASHDLRQPMHALNLYLGALHRLPLDPPAAAIAVNLRLCARSLQDLFDGLLDVSRLDAGAVTPQCQAFAVQEMLERLRSEFQPQASLKGLELRMAIFCPEIAFSDPTLAETIVRNLLSNAIRYTAQGGVLVATRRRGDRLRIAVYDTGPGIAAEQRELVFEEFYQVGNPGRSRAQGLGLGLAIVRRLTNLLGTPLVVDSRPGRGSMFAIDLPLVGQAGALTRRESPATVDLLAGKQVVVVDDDRAILDASRAVLAPIGCEVITAESGQNAVTALTHNTQAPDLLVCDYRLRDGENGFDVIDRLRDEFNSCIPAAVVTGDVVPEDLRRRAGPELVILHKPLTERELIEALTSLLRPKDAPDC